MIWCILYDLVYVFLNPLKNGKILQSGRFRLRSYHVPVAVEVASLLARQNNHFQKNCPKRSLGYFNTF